MNFCAFPERIVLEALPGHPSLPRATSQAALDVADKEDGDAPGAYMNSLTRSLSLALDEFYSSIRSVGVSAATGEGMQDLFDAILDAGKEYMEFYLPELKVLLVGCCASGGPGVGCVHAAMLWVSGAGRDGAEGWGG